MSDIAGADRDLFRLAVDLSPAGIVAVDADGRILLVNREVEDEDYLRLMLEKQIAGYGYRVTAHGSSVEALEDFRSRPGDFDLLVTDNTMPKMTGLALAREVVRLRPELPVLLISGLAEHADPRELETFGVRMLLPKPSRSSELEQAIRKLLGA